MPAIYHEGSWLGNATDPEVLVKDTVGWTGKNRLKVYGDFPKTAAGVTATKNADGSISFSGSATGYAGFFMLRYDIEDNSKDYLLTGLAGTTTNMAWGNTYVYDSSDAVIANIQSPNNADNRVVNFSQYASAAYVLFEVKRLSNGAVSGTLYPMLRKADITDPTYEPYHESVETMLQNQINAQGVLGAKNLLQYPYNNNSKTDHGVTFTVNSDGTIVANGTATTDVYFNLVDTSIKSVLTPLKPNTKYIISGCEGGNNLTYRLWHPLRKSGGGYDGYSQMSEPIEYITPSDLSTYAVTIVIASGATVNNVKFKPMIRLASDPDDTYQPYAMTNRELTEKKINIADLKTVVSASSDFADFKTRIASL